MQKSSRRTGVFTNKFLEFKENLWPNLAFFFYLFLVFTKVFKPDFPYVILVFYGSLIFFSQILFLLTNYPKTLLVSFVYFVFGSYIVAFGDGTMLTPLAILSHLGLFTLLVRFKISSGSIRLLIYIYALYCTYQSVYLGINLNELAGGSRNLLGWIGLGLGIFYYIVRYRNDEKIDVVTSLVVLFIAIICIGRGNIIGSVALFSIILMTKYQNDRLPKQIFIITGILIALLGSIYVFSDFISEKISYFENKGLESNERSMILHAYINKVNAETLIFGVSPNQYPFTILSGNFHNSFLLGHSNFGILFIFFAFFIVCGFFYRWKNYRFLKWLLLILCVRSLTDTVSFMGYFDYLYIFCLVSFFSKKETRNIKTKLGI